MFNWLRGFVALFTSGTDFAAIGYESGLDITWLCQCQLYRVSQSSEPDKVHSSQPSPVVAEACRAVHYSPRESAVGRAQERGCKLLLRVS